MNGRTYYRLIRFLDRAINYTFIAFILSGALYVAECIYAVVHPGRAAEILRRVNNPDIPLRSRLAGCGDISDPIAQGACVVAVQKEVR